MKHSLLLFTLGILGCSEIPVTPSQPIKPATLFTEQSYGTIDSIRFAPVNANKNSLITIYVAGTWGTSYKHEETFTNLMGNTITIDAVISYGQAETQILTGWNANYPVGKLSSGWYTVIVNLRDGITGQLVTNTVVTLVVKGKR